MPMRQVPAPVRVVGLTLVAVGESRSGRRGYEISWARIDDGTPGLG